MCVCTLLSLLVTLLSFSESLIFNKAQLNFVFQFFLTFYNKSTIQKKTIVWFGWYNDLKDVILINLINIFLIMFYSKFCCLERKTRFFALNNYLHKNWKKKLWNRRTKISRWKQKTISSIRALQNLVLSCNIFYIITLIVFELFFVFRWMPE